MTRWLMLAALLLLSTPAWAVEFSVPGCGPGTFDFIARNKIGFENGPVNIDGNLLVTKDDGLIQVGAHNRIKGTAIAEKLFLGTGALVDACIADSITGPGKCTTVLGTFAAAPAACKVFTFTVPPVDPCVNVALLVNVPAGQTETLAPGCYGVVRVGLGATLELADGVYLFRDLRLLTGATLEGTTVGRSRVLVKNSVTISPLSRLLHLNILTSSTVGDSLSFGNSVTFLDVQAIAAGSGIHLHTGFVADSSSFAAVNVVVEPGQGRGGEEVKCACPPGFKLPPGVPAQTCIPDNLLD